MAHYHEERNHQRLQNRLLPHVMNIIEEERRRLRRAHSVMVCARCALDYSDYVEDEWELDVADVVAVACGLVREALVNLDRATLSCPNEHFDSVSRLAKCALDSPRPLTDPLCDVP